VHPNLGQYKVSISSAYLNARSLCAADKFFNIFTIAEIRKFDLFAFSETCRSSTISDESILKSGFSGLSSLEYFRYCVGSVHPLRLTECP